VPLVVSIVALALLLAAALAGVLYTLRDTLAVPDKMFMEMVDDVFDQCDVDKSGAIDEKVWDGMDLVQWAAGIRVVTS
jgi:hypothetical protein